MILFRPLIRYANFNGRANRSEFWLFAVFQGVWYAFLIGLAAAAMGQGDTGRTTAGVMVAFGLIVLSVVGLIIPNYSVLVRRLHDTGRGAIWLCLMAPSIASAVLTLATVGTAVGSVGLGGSRDAFVGTMLAGLGTAGLLGLFGMLGQLVIGVLTLLPGTCGENRFGPDPRDPRARYRAGDGGTPYDEARLEALFAEAKRSNGGGDQPYRPLFDFGPGPAQPAAPTIPRPPVDRGAVRSSGITPAPTFGCRGSLGGRRTSTD